MAESFGIVAGGIGAVSLAVQITEQTRRLRKFLKLIKDAPNETEELLNELDFLANASKVFEDFKNHEASEIGSKCATTALEFCRELVGDLQQLTEELENEFSPKGPIYSWKNMKAGMHMDKLRHMRRQVHDASRILSITTQAKVQ